MTAKTLEVNMYRYNPEEDKFPYIKQYKIEKPAKDIMVLDLLHLLKEQDESISYRRSCREGVCGSDGMNINGKNGHSCHLYSCHQNHKPLLYMTFYMKWTHLVLLINEANLKPLYLLLVFQSYIV